MLFRSLAFSNCAGLTALTLGANTASIGYATFTECTGLTGALTLPDSVTRIGSIAFSGCHRLTRVTLGAGATDIGENAFANCSSLTALDAPAANPAYASIAGVLFNKTATTLIAYPAGKPGAYAIPDGVTRISDCAFSYTPPGGVTLIGDRAFAHCAGLTDIAIPDSVTRIGERAFFSCSLTSATIGAGVTTIGERAFADCKNLTRVTFRGASPSVPNQSNLYANTPNVTTHVHPEHADSWNVRRDRGGTLADGTAIWRGRPLRLQ